MIQMAADEDAEDMAAAAAGDEDSAGYVYEADTPRARSRKSRSRRAKSSVGGEDDMQDEPPAEEAEVEVEPPAEVKPEPVEAVQPEAQPVAEDTRAAETQAEAEEPQEEEPVAMEVEAEEPGQEEATGEAVPEIKVDDAPPAMDELGSPSDITKEPESPSTKGKRKGRTATQATPAPGRAGSTRAAKRRKAGRSDAPVVIEEHESPVEAAQEDAQPQEPPQTDLAARPRPTRKRAPSNKRRRK